MSWTVAGDLDISQQGPAGQISVKGTSAGSKGTVTVVYRVGDCVSAPAVRTVLVPKLIDITGPDCGCRGEELKFQAQIDPTGCGVALRWTGGGNPATGTGIAFTTKFITKGQHEVKCVCGDTVKSIKLKVGEITGGTAARTVALSTETVSFSVQVDTPCAKNSVKWSGGGNPASASGTLVFATQFSNGGSHTVTAACGDSTWQAPIDVCDLTSALNAAKQFFGPSLDFDSITIIASPVIGRNAPGWTANNTIRLQLPQPGTPANPGAQNCPSTETLIHELGHVWEHQDGQAQLFWGTLEQFWRLVTDYVRALPLYVPYDFGGPRGVETATDLRSFNKESQAQIIEEYWRFTVGMQRDSHNNAFNMPDNSGGTYSANLARLVGGAGIGTSSPAGPSVASVADGALAGIVNASVKLIGE